jgi:hypothetical protein
MASEAPGAGGFSLELLLIGLLGLSLPFSNFPFFVWRGFGVDLSHVTGGALVVHGLLRLISGRFDRGARAVLLPGAVVAVVVVVPLAAIRLRGFEPRAFGRTALHFAFFLAVFLAIAFSRLTHERVLRLLAILGVEAALVAGYGLFQAIALPKHWPAGVEFLNRFARTPLRAQGLVWRATATFEEPKWLTIFLLPGIVYLYRVALANYRRGKPVALAACIVGIGLVDAGVVATGSLGGIPAAVVLTGACVLDFLLRTRATRAQWLLAAGCGLLLAVAVVFALNRSSFARYLSNRVASERGQTVTAEYAAEYPSGYRYVQNFRYAVSVFRESPLVGIGLGQFGPVGAVRGVELGFPTELTRDGPWIGLGGLLAEIGVLGTGALVWLLFRALGGHALVAPARSPAVRDDQISAWLVVLAVLLKEVYSGFYVHFWTWFPLGIAACLVRSRMAERASGENWERAVA